MVTHKLTGPVEADNTIRSGPIPQGCQMDQQGGLSAAVFYGTVVENSLAAPGPHDLPAPALMFRLNVGPAPGVIRSMVGIADAFGRGAFGTLVNISSTSTPVTIQNDTPDVLPLNQKKILTHTGADFVLGFGRSATVMFDTVADAIRIIGVA